MIRSLLKTPSLRKIVISLCMFSLCFPAFAKHSTRKHTHHKSHHVAKNPAGNSKIVHPITIDNSADIDSVVNDNMGPTLYSYAAVAYDVDNDKIIFSKHANTILPMASITKLMTAIIVLESDVSLSDSVTISEDDTDSIRNTYSRLRIGQSFTRKNLLLMALMSSENRAAACLGRTTYDNTSQFVKKMNEKAKELGMNNTKFYDTTGLDQRNISSPLDLVKLVKAAFKYKEIKNFSTTEGADVSLGGYYHHYINSDALVRGHNMPILLSKTGFINESGHHVALYTMINNRPVIIVLMDSASTRARSLDGIAIKHYLMNTSW